MSSIDVPRSVRRRQSPTRVVGAATTVRFGLLSLFIAVGSMSLLPTAIVARHGGPRWSALCALASGADPNDPSWPAHLGSSARTFYESCVDARVAAVPVTWMTLETAFVFVLAVAIYLWLPAWRRRGGKLLPIALTSHSQLATELRECVALAGLRRAPAFVIDPAGRSSDAVVFGRLGSYTVRLNGGLVVRGEAEPAVLRTVVLHELAHIRNRDVDITFATVALWRAFVIGAVLPFVVLVVYPTVGSTALATLQSMLRPAILTVFVYLMRADILRTRETFADVDAAEWSSDQTAWRGQLHDKERKFPFWQRVSGLWRNHPSWFERNRSIIDSATLFGVSALPMFFTGMTAMLVPIAAELVVTGFGYPSSTAASWPGVWLTTAALATAVVGVALLRGVAHALATGTALPSGVRAGAWFGIGMAVGELLSFRTSGEGHLPAHPWVLVGVVVGATVLTWWMVECADLWLRTCRGASIHLVQLIGLAAAFVVFSVWFGYWVSDAYVLLIGFPSGIRSMAPGLPAWVDVIFGVVTKPWLFAGAAALWLLPLASWLRRPPVTTPAWVRQFDVGPPATGERPGSDLQPAAGSVGLVPAPASRFPTFGIVLGGVLCCVAVAAVMLSLHPAQPAPGGRDAGWALHYLNRLSIGLILAISTTAIVVVFARRRHHLTFALVSAGGAALVGLSCVFLLASVDGCIEPMQVMASTCSWRPVAAWSTVTPLVPFVLDIAIYAAALAALLALGLLRLLGVLVPRFGALRYQPSPQASSSGTVVARRLAVLAACALVMVFTSGARGTFWNDAKPTMPIVADPPRHQPPATVRVQVAAWWAVGGGDLVQALGHDFQREGAAAAGQARAAARAGQTSVEIDRSLFRPICADIATDAHKAAVFAPIPDRQAQSAWAAAHTDAGRSSSDCRHALQDDDGQLFTRSLAEGTRAAAALRTVLARVNSL